MEPHVALERPGPSVILDLPDLPEPQGFGVVPGLVWAFLVRDDGSAEPIDRDGPIASRRDGWLWLHLNLADARAAEWLRATKLPAAALTMMLSRDRHQQLHAVESCIYGTFADFVTRLEGPGDDIGHLRFVMTERVLVSGRHHALCSAEWTRETIERGQRRLPRVASLLELIVEHVGDAIERLADKLATDLDQIESNLATGRHKGERTKLTQARQAAAKLHRQLSGLRALFHRLERDGTEHVKPGLRLPAGALAQRLDALDHDIVETRHRAQLLQEEIAAATAEETNRNLHVLAVVTALFLPPTLVAGVFGMSTKGLPFAETENAFLSAAALMVASAAAVYLLLRRIGIFKL
jgi:zinc transporter